MEKKETHCMPSKYPTMPEATDSIYRLLQMVG